MVNEDTAKFLFPWYLCIGVILIKDSLVTRNWHGSTTSYSTAPSYFTRLCRSKSRRVYRVPGMLGCCHEWTALPRINHNNRSFLAGRRFVTDPPLVETPILDSFSSSPLVLGVIYTAQILSISRVYNLGIGVLVDSVDFDQFSLIFFVICGQFGPHLHGLCPWYLQRSNILTVGYEYVCHAHRREPVECIAFERTNTWHRFYRFSVHNMSQIE
jgi:hypothetical protein